MISRFIVIEGCDGIGKTSQAQALAGALCARGYSVTTTCEPPKQGRGGDIRQSLMAGRFVPHGRLCQAVVFLLARLSHLYETVIPALNQGHIVITDRFTDSTLAYQFTDEDFANPSDEFRAYLELQEIVLGSCRPGLKILLDAPFDAVSDRFAARAAAGATPDAYETDSQLVYGRIRAAFLKLRDIDPGIWRTVNAEPMFGAVHLKVKHAVLDHLRLHGIAPTAR